jgi:hypothetical protein
VLLGERGEGRGERRDIYKRKEWSGYSSLEKRIEKKRKQNKTKQNKLV